MIVSKTTLAMMSLPVSGFCRSLVRSLMVKTGRGSASAGHNAVEAVGRPRTAARSLTARR